ncbi:MAG TPA: hypothetical protein IGS17_00340 [Oscillatoriales cyanobacterium M59_W2019_021]|nr:hypothetical protein [Oscillatoriales cyanobacterium M59_W2019_021]
MSIRTEEADRAREEIPTIWKFVPAKITTSIQLKMHGNVANNTFLK